MSDRIVDPRNAALRTGMRSEGWQSQRDLQQADEETRRFADAGLDRLIIQETFTSWIFSPPANTVTSMLVQFATGFSATGFSSTFYRTPAQGRLLLIRLSASGTVTAGTITPRLSVTEGGFGTFYDFADCQLSTADPQYNTSRFNWENAPQIARDANIFFRVSTSAAFAPTNINFALQAVVGYEDWASS